MKIFVVKSQHLVIVTMDLDPTVVFWSRSCKGPKLLAEDGAICFGSGSETGVPSLNFYVPSEHFKLPVFTAKLIDLLKCRYLPYRH